MKLTNNLRDAFIRSAMGDVPAVDYDAQIQAAINAATLAAMPPKVRALLKDPDCEAWLNRAYVSAPKLRGSKSAYAPRHGDTCSGMHFTEAERENLGRLQELKEAQKKQRDDLQDKLHTVAYGCTTRKALAEALPEFAHYLPADEATAKTVNLPALANVVADFVKAGWPKGKRVAA